MSWTKVYHTVVLEERGVTRKPYVEKLPHHSRVFQWVESCNSEHKTVKQRISPSHPTTACTSSDVPCLSDIMENRRVAIDKLQLATSLCHAKIHAIIHKDLEMRKVCALWVSKELNPK